MKKNILLITLLEMVAFWGIWIMKDYLWLYGMEFLSELLRYVLFVGVIILLISHWNILKKYVFTRTVTRLKAISFILIISLSILFNIYLYRTFSEGNYHSGSVTNIESKRQEGNNFYININSLQGRDFTLKCDEEIYKEIICDPAVLYSIEYRWLAYNNKAVIETIDTEEIVDNR